MSSMDILNGLREYDQSCYIQWRLCRYPNSEATCDGSALSRSIIEIGSGFDIPARLYGPVAWTDPRLVPAAGSHTERPLYRLECNFYGEWHTLETLVPAVTVSSLTDDIVRRYLALRMRAVRKDVAGAAPTGLWRDMELALLGQPLTSAG